MHKKEYYEEYGATAACTLRLLKPWFRSSFTRHLTGDSWFGSVKVAIKLEQENIVSKLSIKTNTSQFPMKRLIEETGAQRGDSLTLGAEKDGVKFMAVGWRRRRPRGEKHFVSTVLSTVGQAGDHPQMASYKRHDEFGNRKPDFKISIPWLFYLYYIYMAMIDRVNQLRQGILNITLHWHVKDAFLCFFAHFLGLIVVNAYKLMCFHGNHDDAMQEESLMEFVEKLSLELLQLGPKSTAASTALTAPSNQVKEVAGIKVGYCKKPSRCCDPLCKKHKHPGRSKYYCLLCFEASKKQAKKYSEFTYCGALETSVKEEKESIMVQRGCLLRHIVESHCGGKMCSDWMKFEDDVEEEEKVDVIKSRHSI